MHHFICIQNPWENFGPRKWEWKTARIAAILQKINKGWIMIGLILICHRTRCFMMIQSLALKAVKKITAELKI